MARLRAQGFIGGNPQYLAGAPRKGLDAYPTPPEATQALLDAAPPPPGIILEPSCGKGDMARIIERNGWPVIARDIRRTGYGEAGRDYLEDDRVVGISGIITNPPYKLAAQFVAKALQEAPYVALLLKSTFWHAAGRRKLFEAHPPTAMYALTWRLAFLAKERGNQPMMETMWCVWDSRIARPSGEPIYRLLDRPAGVAPLAPLLETGMASLEEVIGRLIERLEGIRAGR
jgi:hypothetical protein